MPSYSQASEDTTLVHLFLGKKDGVYVDIGAYDPNRFSNTKYLYQFLNWRGINVDANPFVIEKFKKERERDINLNIGVGLVEEERDFYIFDEYSDGFEHPMNSFNGDKFDEEPREKKKISIKKMSTLLDEHLSKLVANVEIDILSVDVEGLDLEVLKSNDWDKYRPKALVVECVNSFLSSNSVDEISDFIVSQGYKKLFVLPVSSIFVREDLELSEINQLL